MVETDALARAVEMARDETGAPSVTVAVWQAGGRPCTASSGAPLGDLRYWASVGKIVTPAAVLRLAEDGRVALDAAISRYVNGVPNGNAITLRMPPNHSSPQLVDDARCQLSGQSSKSPIWQSSIKRL